MKILAEDVFSRVNFVLSTKSLDPQFQGQTKEKLTSRDAVKLVGGFVRPQFEFWLNDHADEGKKLVEHIISQAQARQRQAAKYERRRASTVAVLPGSGDSLFDEVRAAGVDVYVTSDLRHHPVTDAIEQARYEASMRAADIELGRGDATVRPMFINTPHSAIESIWFQYAMGDVPRAVSEATGDIPTVRWISMNTDPWNLVLPSCGQER